MAVRIDFSTALLQGIYFDHCIDLSFYGEDMTFLYGIKTPDIGYKPDITVKGTMIEGSYTISSFITVTNMHYDIDINAVYYIKCRMYYKGLLGKSVGAINNYQGHTILFSVLYADQEKEPPNRAIRFQCTVAAKDYTRLDSKVFIDSYGKFTAKAPNDDGKGQIKDTTLKNYLQNLCEIYNSNLPNYFKKEGANTYDMRIKSIYFMNKKFETEKVSISPYSGNINNCINSLNTITRNINGMSYRIWKIYLEEGRMVVSVVSAPNSELENNEWYKERTDGKGTYLLDQSSSDNTSEPKSVIMYFTKSAYRNEGIINVVTMFDDRIYPGCLVSIMANTVMGKTKGKSSKLRKFTNEIVTFRVTGKIDYEFSTTQGGYMAMQGPVVREDDANSFKSWSGVSING
jgi:hypothetical protein